MDIASRLLFQFLQTFLAVAVTVAGAVSGGALLDAIAWPFI